MAIQTKKTEDLVTKMMEDLGRKADPKVVEKVSAKIEKAFRFKNKVRITLGVDPDVLEYFQSGGPGYQTRINAALKEYVDKNS